MSPNKSKKHDMGLDYSRLNENSIINDDSYQITSKHLKNYSTKKMVHYVHNGAWKWRVVSESGEWWVFLFTMVTWKWRVVSESGERNSIQKIWYLFHAPLTTFQKFISRPGGHFFKKFWHYYMQKSLLFLMVPHLWLFLTNDLAKMESSKFHAPLWCFSFFFILVLFYTKTY